MPAEVVIPAPVGGWNARDALASMPPADAVTLINWVPGNGIVQGRGGSLTVKSGLGAAVDTLVTYAASTTSSLKLLAAYGGNISDMTGFGVPTVLGSGFASDRWQTATFDDHLVFVNGASAPQVYNGTALSAMTITALATPVNVAFTPGAGTLSTATYYYRVSAINQNGETLASTETSLALTGPAGVNVNWGAVTGATGYKVYGRSTGAELLIATVGAVTTYLDSGAVTPAGALPVANTTAVTGTNLVGVVNFKGRAFYWENHSTNFWYAAAGSFQGTLTKFPFANFVQKGGYIVQIISWTRDSGDGVDDYCAFVFSTGETLLYQGDDPSIINQWSMIGRYQLGVPLAVRGHARYASTDIIITSDGFVGLDEALQNARTQLDSTFGGKVINAAKLAAQKYKANFGWEAVFYPRSSLFLVNIPISSTQFEQYTKNTNTGAWCRFTGWPARTFVIYQDRLYFGTQDGKIVLADVTSADTNTRAYSDDGNPIVYEALTAYQAFGQPGLKSNLTAARVVMNIFDGRALSLNSFVDYRPRSLPPLATPVEQTVGQWDVSFWDADYWAGPDDLDPASLDARPILRPITGFGFAIAMSVRYQSLVQNVAWYSSTFIYKQAGVN